MLFTLKLLIMGTRATWWGRLPIDIDGNGEVSRSAIGLHHAQDIGCGLGWTDRARIMTTHPLLIATVNEIDSADTVHIPTDGGALSGIDPGGVGTQVRVQPSAEGEAWA